MVRYGNTGPGLGLAAETTGLVQEFNIKRMYDEIEVPNNIGEVVTFGQFNERWEGQIVLIDTSGGSMPQAATEVAFVNLTTAPPSGGAAIPSGDPTQVIITSHDRKPEQKGAQKHTFDFKAFVNIA